MITNILINFFNYIKFSLYNLIVSKYTILLYKNFLKKIPNDSTVLDIGIGNAYSLVKNSDLLVKKNIKIVGIDIDQTSINQANILINDNKLEEYIKAKCINIYDLNHEEKFDFVYFSNSYSVIPGIDEMINFVSNNFLLSNGKIALSTTLDNRTNYLKEYLKPKLKNFFLGIDFGRHIIIDQFLNNVVKNKLSIDNIENVYQTWVPLWGNIDIYTCFLGKES
tara:strand:+ start:865 stop:1530 length:666 start_codon:yes stop_codon:yes gene_type:complete